MRYDFTETFEKLYSHLEDLTEIAEMNLENVDLREDIQYARTCLDWIEEIGKLKQLSGKIQDRMEAIRQELSLEEPSCSATKVSDGELRKVQIEVTEGMIRQSLLTLTGARKAGVVKVGEQFRLKLPDGKEFTTEIIEPGNKFRERGRIREFYDSAQAKPGDYVELNEAEPGIWSMRLRRGNEVSSELMKDYLKLI